MTINCTAVFFTFIHDYHVNSSCATTVVGVQQTKSIQLSPLIFGHKTRFFGRIFCSVVVKTTTLRLGLHCSCQFSNSLNLFRFLSSLNRLDYIWQSTRATSLTACFHFIHKFYNICNVFFLQICRRWVPAVLFCWGSVVASRIGLEYLSFWSSLDLNCDLVFSTIHPLLFARNCRHLTLYPRVEIPTVRIINFLLIPSSSLQPLIPFYY